MIEFCTMQPHALLEAFKTAIDSGEITSWRYDREGRFTLTSSQWTRQAWFIPIAKDQRLVMYISRLDSKTMTRAVFVYYQAHILETFMRHLFCFYDQASATSSAGELDWKTTTHESLTTTHPLASRAF
jgi:hypothetical protein